MTREELSPKALEMLKAHNLDEVFITSDGQGFTDLHRAENHAAYLKTKRIERFAKSKEAVSKEVDTDKKDEDKTDDERQQLAQRYEELYGKKPNHNTGVEKLKAQIAEKEAELEKEDAPVLGEETDKSPEVENKTTEKKDLKED